MVLGNMEVDCWRTRYKNTDETTYRFIVKNILSHVFSFFTLLINKRNPLHSNLRTTSARDQVRNWKHFLRLLLHSLGPPFIGIKTKCFKVHHSNERHPFSFHVFHCARLEMAPLGALICEFSEIVLDPWVCVGTSAFVSIEN